MNVYMVSDARDVAGMRNGVYGMVFMVLGGALLFSVSGGE